MNEFDPRRPIDLESRVQYSTDESSIGSAVATLLWLVVIVGFAIAPAVVIAVWRAMT